MLTLLFEMHLQLYLNEAMTEIISRSWLSSIHSFNAVINAIPNELIATKPAQITSTEKKIINNVRPIEVDGFIRVPPKSSL